MRTLCQPSLVPGPQITRLQVVVHAICFTGRRVSGLSEELKMTDTGINQNSVTLPTLEQVYEVLKNNYKPTRFEDRDGTVWGEDYSLRVARSRLEDLEKYGKAFVSQHEDRLGEGFSFGPDLVVIR